MDILVLSRVYPPYGAGGLAYHLKYLYEEIASSGHKITILGGKCRGFKTNDQFDSCGNDNITVNRVEFGYREGYYVLYPLALRWYLRNFDTSRFDVVLTHTPIPFEFEKPVIAKKHDCNRKSRHYVRESMNPWKKMGESVLNWMRPFIDKGALRSADYLIFNSKLTRDGWNDLYDISTPSSVIHNGVDINIFYPRDNDWDDGYILFVTGSGDGAKDKLEHSGVLDFAEESSKDVYVAGRSNIDRPKITALGYLNHEELANAYSAAAVTIHPSIYEPFGNVVLESLACGTPVVTTKSVGASEILNKNCGVVTEDLHKGVQTAMNLKSADCIENARNHTWTRVADETMNIVQTLTSNC